MNYSMPRDLLDVLRNVCTKLPGAEEYVMVHHPAFRVGKRRVCLLFSRGDALRGDRVTVRVASNHPDREGRDGDD